MSKGRLVIKEVEFEQLLKRKVTRNNETSGEVTLPRRLVGKNVYVMVAKEEGQNG